MARPDPHSYVDDAQPRTDELLWKVAVDFERRVLTGSATLRFREPGGGPLDLDTRDLVIHRVVALDGTPVRHALQAAEPILGARLRIDLPAGSPGVQVWYETRPEASALQWLTAAQTRGGKHPFLFSQCQAVHARSMVPLQYTPSIRIRYAAELTVPRALRAIAAAAFIDRREEGAVAIERYQMPQPVPPYLLAFAVGNLAFHELAPRAGVWAEPETLAAAVHEFSGVDAMLTAAETLFGPYDWERFDLLVMPPSFPYGGMENPRLTFLTPTLLAGDRSLVSVVAHELAHSWTGNLVSNANAEHFWLNEGFTVFAERRILEVLEGQEALALHAALGRRALDEAVARFSDHPELTRLRTQLTGVDPDDAYSQVPYEKGYLFLRALELSAGREAFDAFLRRYLETYRFQSITTDDFLAVAHRWLPGALEAVDARAWIDGPGIPANAPVFRSARQEKIEALVRTDALPSDEARGWSPQEWQLYLESVPAPTSEEVCAALDGRFLLTQSRHYELLTAWLVLAMRSGHAPAFARAEQVVAEVGRMRYLRPLYQGLAFHDPARARATFERCRAGYHPIAVQLVEGLLREAALR